MTLNAHLLASVSQVLVWWASAVTPLPTLPSSLVIFDWLIDTGTTVDIWRPEDSFQLPPSMSGFRASNSGHEAWGSSCSLPLPSLRDWPWVPGLPVLPQPSEWLTRLWLHHHIRLSRCFVWFLVLVFVHVKFWIPKTTFPFDCSTRVENWQIHRPPWKLSTATAKHVTAEMQLIKQPS